MMHQASSSTSKPSLPPLPPELESLIQTKTLRSRAYDLYLKYLSLAIQKDGPNTLGSLIIHPEYPYHTLFKFDPYDTFSPELYCFLYYLLEQYSIGFQFHAATMISWILGVILQQYSDPEKERQSNLPSEHASMRRNYVYQLVWVGDEGANSTR